MTVAQIEGIELGKDLGPINGPSGEPVCGFKLAVIPGMDKQTYTYLATDLDTDAGEVVVAVHKEHYGVRRATVEIIPLAPEAEDHIEILRAATTVALQRADIQLAEMTPGGTELPELPVETLQDIGFTRGGRLHDASFLQLNRR
ncbi:MAG TPA: hypothetical protein VK534_00190 [Methylomirabilota bacterium]|nr:hypothetical protein [Methylomirabilota bacterium]